jgi:hypothetical protein
METRMATTELPLSNASESRVLLFVLCSRRELMRWRQWVNENFASGFTWIAVDQIVLSWIATRARAAERNDAIAICISH